MFTKAFWMQATERAVKTLAQTFIALVAAESVFNIFTFDWVAFIGVSVGAALLSVATSIISAEIGDYANPSLVKPEPDWADDHVKEEVENA